MSTATSLARPYGYVSFSYDITPYLNAGGDNVIAVKVDNSEQPNSRWYSGCGIYRNVWLRHLGYPVHVPLWGQYVTANKGQNDRQWFLPKNGDNWWNVEVKHHCGKHFRQAPQHKSSYQPFILKTTLSKSRGANASRLIELAPESLAYVQADHLCPKPAIMGYPRPAAVQSAKPHT